MTNSPLTINGKRLAARWNVETVDLLYIMLNHDLNVIHPYEGSMSLDDIFEIYYNDKDVSTFLYRLSEVKNIETELGIDGEIPLSECIRGKDLEVRWELNNDQVYMIMSDLGLEAVDPFGYKIGNNFLSGLITSNTLYVWDLLFRLSDIEDLESKYPEIVVDRTNYKKPEKKLRANQLHKIKCREVAQKLWKEDSSIWAQILRSMLSKLSMRCLLLKKLSF